MSWRRQIWKYLLEIYHVFLLTLLFIMHICPTENITDTKSIKTKPYCVAKLATNVHLDKDDRVDEVIWFCPPCIQCILPFNHVDDNDVFIETVIEASLDCNYRIHEINTKIFVPFEINDDSPFHERDPDLQFYSDNHYIQSTSCDYYLEDSIND